MSMFNLQSYDNTTPEQLARAIHKVAGAKIDPADDAALGELFVTMKIPGVEKRGGAWRLSWGRLRALADQGHEIAGLVLAWRHLKRREALADVVECVKLKARMARVMALAKREVSAARLTYADAAIALADALERRDQTASWTKLIRDTLTGAK
jgi:DNA polymerase I-like protein with 3'-5' exonuclease and polymerase domains